MVEVPVGFKWFVDPLFTGEIAFGGEESSGMSFLRFNGRVWTTDKDGIIPRPAGRGDHRQDRPRTRPSCIRSRWTVSARAGIRASTRDHARAEAEVRQARRLRCDRHEARRRADRADSHEAPGNDAPIGGIKVVTKDNWFAARPSGTENIYKVYAESFVSPETLDSVLTEATEVVDKALGE
mgnify:CR=1 FL=1